MRMDALSGTPYDSPSAFFSRMAMLTIPHPPLPIPIRMHARSLASQRYLFIRKIFLLFTSLS